MSRQNTLQSDNMKLLKGIITNVKDSATVADTVCCVLKSSQYFLFNNY